MSLVWAEGIRYSPGLRLSGTTTPLHHIHQIVHNPVFETHDNIQIAQPDIGIDQAYFLPRLGQTGSNVCGCGGLTHTAFP